ncbi:unnamed protein product [Rotaria sp. Silwood2]|nr:unnamed protein product [Rotaria sp. Silwood2]
MMFKTLSILLIIYLIDCVVAQSKSETVLFISIPFIGHLNPLLNQVIELYQHRDIDYNIYIISCSNVKTYVETRCWNTTIKFLDIGQCQNDTEIASNFKNIAAQTSSGLNALSILEQVIEKYYPQMYEQADYLAHPNVHLFIFHCGINSAYESIWLSTSILCIPIIDDQQDMAQCLEDAGIGRWLHKYDFTSEKLKQTIEMMLNNEERLFREKNIKRIETIMKLDGDAEHAVDLIEMFAEYGIKSLVPINNSSPFYAYHNYRFVCNMTICFNWIKIII